MKINGENYELKKENYKIKNFDKIYCSLLENILENGEIFDNRTGINTLSIEGVYFKLNVGDEYPILESKKVAIKNALSEMQWIYQAQTNNVEWLRQRANNIWNEWEVSEDGIYRIYEPYGEYDESKEVEVYDLDGNLKHNKDGSVMKAKSLINGKTIKSAKYYGLEYAGTIGTAYGWINNKYKRPQYVLNKLKTDPHDRRMLISLWQDAHLKTAVLPSCVWSSTWKVSKGKLNCFVNQRSADVPLGLPFNISQYAMLLAMFAKVSNLEVGNLNWGITDAHIYVNQLEGIKLQLERYKKMQYYEKLFDSKSEDELQSIYNELKNKYEYLNNTLVTTEKIEKEKKELKENIMIFELMATKEKTILDVKERDNFFEYSTDVINDKSYIKNNPTGNEDIKVLKYKSAPFIKMDIAQ